MCEWGAIERVQPSARARSSALDTTARTGAIMVRKDSEVRSLADLRNVPIAVTWHAGTFYAAIEVLEAAGVPSTRSSSSMPTIVLTRCCGQDRGRRVDGAAGQPRGEAGCRQIADLRWRGGIVAGDDVDEETAAKLRRALNRAVEWLRENEDRSREELLRDLKPELRKTACCPNCSACRTTSRRIPGKGRLDDGSRLLEGGARLQGCGSR